MIVNETAIANKACERYCSRAFEISIRRYLVAIRFCTDCKFMKEKEETPYAGPVHEYRGDKIMGLSHDLRCLAGAAADGDGGDVMMPPRSCRGC